jgi:hypothetical protein
MFRNKLYFVLVACGIIVAAFFVSGADAEKDRISVATASAFLHELGRARINAGNPGGDSSPVRSDAIYLLGLYEAVNSIERKYEPFMVPFSSIPSSINTRKCNNVVAAAQAARRILDWLFPTPFPSERFLHHEFSLIQMDTTKERLTDEERDQSIALGDFVASVIIANRSQDGWRASPPLTGPIVNGTKAGEWIYGTPLYNPFVFGSGYALHVKPFNRLACSDPMFYVPPPPAWGSALYNSDLEEVFPIGASDPARNGNTTETFTTALFHDGYFAAGTHLLHDFITTARHNLDDIDLLRALALTSVVTNDAHACHWYPKFIYNRARPATDFHMINVTANPELAHLYDPAWRPPRNTAGNPEYPSGHSSRSGSAWWSMRKIFGDIQFRAQGFSTPNLRRFYPSISAFIQEVNDARVYGGMHYRSGCDEAVAYGKRIADQYHLEIMRPLA